MSQQHDPSSSQTPVIAGIVKRGAITLLLAAIIFAPTILLKTQVSQISNTLFIRYRWEGFAIACALVLIWRIIHEIRILRKARAHHKCIGELVGKLLVFNNVAATCKNRCRHGMHDARLIFTLKCCEQIHHGRIRGIS